MRQEINFDWISTLATAVNSDKELTAVGGNFTTNFVIVFGLLNRFDLWRIQTLCTIS